MTTPVEELNADASPTPTGALPVGSSARTSKGFTRSQWQRLISRQSTVSTKENFILAVTKGRRVLDIGCIDHSAMQAGGANWLHARIADQASSVVGLDYLESDVADVRALGFDVRAGDACDFDLGERFDVVVAGDIIEHLTNLDGFLNCVRRHLEPSGVLVITTPNPFNIEQMLWATLRGKVNVNDEHVMWLDPMVMWQLLDREGYSVKEFSWLVTRFRFALPEDTRLLRATNRLAKLAMRRWPLVRRDFGVVASPR
ncbi:MAG: methyltransferase domain-containing protein [Actinomycetes bacterium]